MSLSSKNTELRKSLQLPNVMLGLVPLKGISYHLVGHISSQESSCFIELPDGRRVDVFYLHLFVALKRQMLQAHS